MIMKVLIINGPNLNLLGKRNQSIYGKETLEEINESIRLRGEELKIKVDFFQSNCEGLIVDKLHESMDIDYSGIIINPAAFTHYSLGIRDAIEVLVIPVIEVHLSNINAREDFRKQSVIAPVCTGQISGLGINSYIVAMEGLKLLNK